MARTTPRMGLRVWDDANDTYDNEQQADNWLKVDFHNHTPGRGEQIPTGGITDGAVTAIKIADATISAAKLADNSVTNAKLVDDAVTGVELADASVGQAHLTATALQGVVPWTLIGSYSGAWDVASLANGATATTNVTVTGAAVGDLSLVTLSSLTAADWRLNAHVVSTNTVRVNIANNTGGTVDLPSGTLKVKVVRFV